MSALRKRAPLLAAVVWLAGACLPGLSVPDAAQLACRANADCPANLPVCHEERCVKSLPTPSDPLGLVLVSRLAASPAAAPGTEMEARPGDAAALARADGQVLEVRAERGWRPLPVSEARLPPRRGHAGAWDPARRRLVVFGGLAGAPNGVNDSDYQADTWEWSLELGGWAAAATAGPVPRAAHAAAWDAARERVVLAGGVDPARLLDDLWEFDGRRWRQLPGLQPGPGARYGHSLAYDPDADTLLLFGGEDEAGRDPAGLWVRAADGAWTAVAGGPSGRFRASMTWQQACGSLLLFGGEDAGGLLGDTWEWSAAGGWQERARSGPRPAARESATLEHAVATGRSLLFGGAADDAALDDLWEWDCAAGAWTQVPRGEGLWPRPRYSAASGWDPERRWMIVAGGYSRAPLNDLLAWDADARQWRDLDPGAQFPSPRTSRSVAWDPARGTVLVFGGLSREGLLGDLWEWDLAAGRLREVVPQGPAPDVADAAAVWDPHRRRALLFGGIVAFEAGGPVFGRQLLEWDPATRRWSEHARAEPWPPAWCVDDAVWHGGRRSLWVHLSPGSYCDAPRGGEIWEWRSEPGGWARRDGPGGPTEDARCASLAWDAARDRLVALCQPADGSAAHLWEWDETGWTRRAAGGDALPQGATRALYDAAGGHVLVLTAATSTCWEWDGAAGRLTRRVGTRADLLGSYVGPVAGGRTGRLLMDDGEWRLEQWGPVGWVEYVQAGAASAPQGRRWGSLAYDARRGRHVLFGAHAFAAPFRSEADLWELDSATGRWEGIPIAGGPAARAWHAAAFDPLRGKVLLDGGAQISLALPPDALLWEWDGAARRWSARPEAPREMRRKAAAAFDPGRGRLLVHGGSRVADADARDTLAEWDPAAGTWTTLDEGIPRPPARWDSAAAFDEAGGRLLLFGGMTAAPGRTPPHAPLADLWSWSPAAGAWTQLDDGRGAPEGLARAGHVLAVDPLRRVLVTFGGEDSGGSRRDVWERPLAGGAWVERTPREPSAGRVGASAAWDDRRRSIVVFGGRNEQTRLADTLEWPSKLRDRPAVVFRVAPQAAAPARMQLDIVAGAGAPGAPPGVELLVWAPREARWKPLAAGDAPAEQPARLAFVLEGAADLARLRAGPEKALVFALAGRDAPEGSDEPARIVVDQVSVRSGE